MTPNQIGSNDSCSMIGYRLYNNRAAQNDSNHRYVVSESTRDQMVQAGWLDEGISFCVSAATDSRAFGSF